MSKSILKQVSANLRQLLAAICVLGVSTVATATGGKDGGGGNVCWRNGSAILLELADLPLHDRGDQLKQTDLTKTLGIDIIHTKRLRSFRQAHELINGASKLSPSIQSVLHQALDSIRFYAADFTSSSSLRAGSTALSKCDRISAAAVYKWLGVVLISIHDFNQLDSTSQSGLFIHEALRLLQVTFALNLTDSDLQILTRALVLGDEIEIVRLTDGWPDFSMTPPSPGNLELNSLGTTRIYGAIGLVDDLNRKTLSERKAMLRANWRSMREIVESALKNPDEAFKN